tara:strand:+ start:9619 stop:10074 length:456 start_codon:yes stop_codon:yes gene_type:complete
MPRGYKTCPKCGDDKVPSFLKKCKCGEVFLKKKKTKTFNEGHERLKNFISRSLSKKLSGREMAREMHVAKIMLGICYDDYDFLSKFKVPSWIKDSLLWFKSKDGKKFLERKYHEYLFKPEVKEDIYVDEGSKKGEDVIVSKPRSIRQFLDE